MTTPRKHDILRASELGEYTYCARAWWLRRVQGVNSINVAELQSGQRGHSEHGRIVAQVYRQQRLAWLLAGAALVMALASLALAAAGGG